MDDDTSPSTRKFERSGPSGPDDVRILGDTGDETASAGGRYEPYKPDILTPARNTQEWLPEPEMQGPRQTERPQPLERQPAQTIVKRGPSTCAVVAAILGVLTFSCLLLAFATLRDGLSGFQKLSGLVPSFGINLVTTPTVTIDTSRPSVVERVQALSKLETVHYQIEKVISGTSSGPLPPPLTGDKILLVAHGEVVAGIDLSKVQPDSVDEVGTAVTLTLPPPEILSSKLDNDKTHVYDRQTGIFSKPDPNLESQLRATAEQQIVQAATEDGILTQARQNAEQTLRTLLEGLGYDKITFKEAP